MLKKLFQKLVPTKKTPPRVNKEPVPKTSPNELSLVFVTSLLGESQHDDIGRSNDLDSELLLKIKSELATPNMAAIPKLAQASVNLMKMLMDENVATDELVRVVEEDPALLGKVLELANSAFYKTSKADITSLNQALVMLGNDGLRKLVISTLMADKLKISSAYFKFFGANIWKHSHEVAIMGAAYSSAQGVNEFRAYLNGLIHDIGKIVIFKLLIEVLKDKDPDKYPTATFFAKLIDTYGHKLTLTILQEWALSPEWIKPILTYQSKISPEKMDIDSRGLYLANHISEYHFLKAKGLISDLDLDQALLNKGIDKDLYIELTKKI